MCPAGFYGNDVICLPCSQNCLTCNVDPLYCTSCNKGNYLNTNNICIVTCEMGYYPRNTDFTCQKCHETCLDCFGPSDTDCASCYSPRFLQ